MLVGPKGRGKGALKAFPSPTVSPPELGLPSMGTGSESPGKVSVVSGVGGGKSRSVHELTQDCGDSGTTMVGRVTEILDISAFWMQIGTGMLQRTLRGDCLCWHVSLRVWYRTSGHLTYKELISMLALCTVFV